MLRGAGLLDEAHAAMHLHAERGDLDADVGRERLGDGREQRGARSPALRAASSLPRAAVDGAGGGVADRARGAVERPHGHQHALDVGIMHDGAAGALLALARIFQRLLRRAFGDATPCKPTARRARFIIVNMQACPCSPRRPDSRWRRLCRRRPWCRSARRGCRACARSNARARRCARRASRPC